MRNSTTSRSNYTPPGSFNQEDLEGGMIIPGNWRKDKLNLTSITRIPRKSSTAAQEIRDEYCNFFQTPDGKVSWQENY